MTKKSQGDATPTGRRYVIDLDPEKGGDAFSAVNIEGTIPDEQMITETSDVVENQDKDKKPVKKINLETDDDPEKELENPEEEEEPDEEEEDDEEEDDEEEDEEEEDEEEEDGPANVYFHLGNQLKKDGILSDEVDVTEDITPGEVYDLYKQSNEEQLRQEVTGGVMKELEQQGVTQTDLMYARAIRQGVDVRLLSAASTYEKYGSADLETMSTEEKLDVIKSMHGFRKFTDDESAKIIKSATADGDEEIDRLAASGIKYHKDQFTSFVKSENTRAENRDKQIALQKQESDRQIDIILNKKDLLGDPLTSKDVKALRADLYNADRIVTVGENSYRTTALQEFLIEFNSNPELKLYLYNKYKNKDSQSANLKNKVRNEVENEILSGLDRKVRKDDTKIKKKKKPTSTTDNKRIVNQYLIG